MIVLSAPPVRAQSLPADLPTDVLQRLQQQVNGNALSTANQFQPSPLDQSTPSQSKTTGLAASLTAPAQPQPTSVLEDDYSRRAGATLRQFGYDTFQNFRASTGQVQTGAVPDSYLLGVGDALIITLRGQESRSVETRVDRDGQVVLPDLAPIPAAGRRFADWRADLEDRVAHAYVNTQVFATLGTVRQLSVAVLGEVASPGMFQIGGFGTVLDALALAGGPRKSGTLRHIVIAHADGSRDNLDFYAISGVVSSDQAPVLGLRDGDRILVGSIGPTVALSGGVVRPGIYELPGGYRGDDAAATVSGAALLALGGGPVRPTGNRYLRFSLDTAGTDRALEYSAPGRLALKAGDILNVSPRADAVTGQVYLDGHVRIPGVRSRLAAPDVATLLGTPDTLADNPYLPFAVLDTTDPITRARRLEPVNLVNPTAIALHDDDVLIVLGADEIRYLSSADVQAILNGKAPDNPNISQQTSGPTSGATNASAATDTTTTTIANADTNTNPSLMPYSGSMMSPDLAAQQIQQNSALPRRNATGIDRNSTASLGNAHLCRGLQTLAAVLATDEAQRFAGAIEIAQSKPAVADNQVCPALFDRYPSLLPFALEYATSLSGSVRQPGIYPIAPGADLSTVVSAAGGLTRNADLTSISLTRYSSSETASSKDVTVDGSQLVMLLPGDTVRIPATVSDREIGPVTLSGEFVHPGIYDIRRGEKLSEVIARAGGLSSQAYPYGAVFTRDSVRDLQRDAAQRSARELESGLFDSLQHVGPQQASAQNAEPILQQLVADIRSTDPLGRVVIEADPTILAVKPQLDFTLEAGDALTIPKRPSFVAVTGEVLNPGAEEFTSGFEVADYIRLAGGATTSADKKHIFIVYPNGAAQPVRQAFWNFAPIQLPPGSTIVVPRDTSAYTALGLATVVTQVISQIAITGASLAVIGR